MIIVGGESGPGARPMHPAWARSIRDQCKAAGVPYFFKQWGEWLHDGQMTEADRRSLRSPRQHDWHDEALENSCSHRVGKKAAGRLLDGVEHNEWPMGGRRRERQGAARGVPGGDGTLK